MGLTFLFSSALFALPLAATPVVLHLLYRRKSPVVFFSTIRFIKSSVQRNAARKRVRKWALLACRVLLLALLIAAVAQPVKLLSAGSWTSAGKSSIAAVVVDTSYSMQLLEHGEPVLSKADATVRELLRSQLANAKVALFRSPLPNEGEAERLLSAGAILSQWTPLVPQPNSRPLVDRIASAADLLEREHADAKWLVVISDFQKHDFPSQIPQPKGSHLVLIDLHPQDPRSAGITHVISDPAQPTPGTMSEVVADITGKPNTSRAVALSVNTPAGAKLLEAPVQVANLDSAGHSRLRFKVRLPNVRWLLLTASFPDEDDMAWDNSRAQLIETPHKQTVSFLGPKPMPEMKQFPLWLALDPSEGKWPQAWSLTVKSGNDIAPDADVAVMLAEDWPDDARAARLLSFARGGGTIIFFIRPGLEETWEKLPPNRKTALAALLPSEPMTTTLSPHSSMAVAVQNDPLLKGLEAKGFLDINVDRLVPFSTDPDALTLLNCFPREPRPGYRPMGLLYRKGVGAGTVYTIATLPYSQYTNLAAHPMFLPLIVGMAQRPPARNGAQNIELGQPLMLSGAAYEPFDTLTLQGPRNEATLVKGQHVGGTKQFLFGQANSPGLYAWLKPGSNDPMAMTHVQLPADEAELSYAGAGAVSEKGDNVIIARSVQELQARFSKLDEPQPRWTIPVAIVLLMLCAEALMASLSRLWNPGGLRVLVPKPL